MGLSQVYLSRSGGLKFKPNPSVRLMDQVREVLRYHHYAYRTEQSYCQWILRYIRFHGKTHPKELGVQHVERFLSNLVTEGKVAASTQSQALNAIVFLYREVLHKPLDGEIAPVRSKRQQRPPTVMTQEEVKQQLQIMTGTDNLMAKVLYGSGLCQYMGVHYISIIFHISFLLSECICLVSFALTNNLLFAILPP